MVKGSICHREREREREKEREGEKSLKRNIIYMNET